MHRTSWNRRGEYNVLLHCNKNLGAICRRTRYFASKASLFASTSSYRGIVRINWFHPLYFDLQLRILRSLKNRSSKLVTYFMCTYIYIFSYIMVKWSFNTETTYILYITIEIVETNKRSSLLVQRVDKLKL